MSGGLGGGVGLVMCDLFVSATAALLIVLALVDPEPPVHLPIQSDLVARCPVSNEGFVLTTAERPFGASVFLTDQDDLDDVPRTLGLPGKMLYSVALVPTETGIVSSQCYLRLRDDILRAHNQIVAPGAGAIFTLAIGRPASEERAP